MELKPKITLNAEYLAMINRFYNAQIGQQLLNWPCFSQPQLSSHACNILAKLPGEQTCDYCEHIPYRECSAMCYIHHFCLASFAARLNLQHVKGENLKKTIATILKKWKYPTLNKRVVGTLDLLSEAKQTVPRMEEPSEVTTDKSASTEPVAKEDKMPEVSEKLPEELSPEKPEEVELPVPTQELLPPAPEPKVAMSLLVADPTILPPMPTPEPAVDKTSVKRGQSDLQGFYTVKQLAKRFDCSEGLICRYMSEGGKIESGERVKLECEMDGNRKIVSQASVEAFEKAGVKRRKRRKISEIEAEGSSKATEQVAKESEETTK